jgi:hypothetical protein
VNAFVLRIYRGEDGAGEVRTLEEIQRIESQLTPAILEHLCVVPVKACEDAEHE